MCADDFEAVHGYEPDMGVEGLTFRPGTCSVCGKTGIVFEEVAL
jgi:hypothetical protein